MILNGCVQSSASLFGPAITVAKTGNVYQAGLSYTSSSIFEKKLGKSPAKYLKKFMTNDYNSNSLITAPDKKIKHEKIAILKNKSVNTENSYNDFLEAVNKILK